MEGTAVILISSQRGEGPVLLYKNIFLRMAGFN